MQCVNESMQYVNEIDLLFLKCFSQITTCHKDKCKAVLTDIPKINFSFVSLRGFCLHSSITFKQMPNVGADQADTYKCYAVNEFGKAVVTATLNIIEGEYVFVYVHVTCACQSIY